jgi:uncharacterized protein YaaW (UPF0174 family)
MGYIQDEDLEFLKDVKSEDLDKLVKILITPKTEELTKKDIYKEFAQDHNIYWEEIAAELQLFGGDTIANSVRGRGVKYSEILKDVCRAFDIKLEDEPFLKESIVEKLVNKALKMEMNYPLSIRSLESQLLNKILESDLDKAIQEYNRTKAIKLALLPTKRLSDPNFQVMAQSVYEIAKLRKNYNKQSQEDPKNKKLPLVYSESLTIVDYKDVKMGELKLIDPTSISDLKLENSNNNEINRTMQFIADGFKGFIGTSSKTFELVFSPEVQKGLKSGIYYQTANSPIARSTSTGNIKEHGKILPSGQTKQLLTGGYQLLSIAVAQSHLADIEKSLSSIKSLVENIQERLEAEDRANIKGAIRYLENKIIPLIKNYDGQNEIGQEYKNQFQSIIRDIYTWENKFLEEFEILNKEIQQLNSKDTIGTGNTYEELKTLLKRIEPLKKRYGLILKLSNVLNVVQKFVYFDEKDVLNIDIQLEPFKKLMDEYNMSIDSKKVTLLDSNFNKNDTLAERKKFIEILQNKQNNDFEQFALEYQKQSQRIDEYFENFKNGRASIILSFDEESNIDKYAINYL